MPIDFESILKDDKSFPDALEITFNNEKVPLGAIRNLSKKQQQQITDRLEMVQRERDAVEARQREAQEMAEKATGIYQNLQQQLDATKEEQARNQARNATGGYDPEQEYLSNVWYGPIRKRDQAHEDTLKKINDQLDLLSKTVTAMGTVYTEDRMASEWESTADQRKRSKAVADWDMPRMRKYAEENKINDRLGFPSIKEAVSRLTSGERTQEESQAAYERGLREGELRARMGVMPRPASASAAVTNGQTPPKDLDEALSPDSIAQDEELMQMFSELQRQGADLITGKS